MRNVLFIALIVFYNLSYCEEKKNDEAKLEARFCQDTGTCYVNALAKNLENAMYEEGGINKGYSKSGERSLTVDPYELTRQYSNDKYKLDVNDQGKIKDEKDINRVFKNYEKQLKGNEYDSVISGGFSDQVWKSLVSQGGKVPYYEKNTIHNKGSGIYSDGGESIDSKLTQAQKESGDKDNGVIAIQAGQDLPKRKINPAGELNLENYDYKKLELTYDKDVYWGSAADNSLKQYPENTSDDDKKEIDKLRAKKNEELVKLFDESLASYKGGFIVDVASNAIFDHSTGELKQKYLEKDGTPSQGAHAINVVGKKSIDGKDYYILDDTNPSIEENKKAVEGNYKNSELGATIISAEELYKISAVGQVKPKRIGGGLPEKFKITPPAEYRITGDTPNNKKYRVNWGSGGSGGQVK